MPTFPPAGPRLPPHDVSGHGHLQPGGYSYEVTAVVNNDASRALQESVPSNIVPATVRTVLTGCYTVTLTLVSPASAFKEQSCPSHGR